MEKKDKADLIVMIVLFLSALLVIVSGVRPASSHMFTGASIMFAAALITRRCNGPVKNSTQPIKFSCFSPEIVYLSGWYEH